MGNTHHVPRILKLDDKSLVSIAFVTKDQKTSTFVKQFVTQCTNTLDTKAIIPGPIPKTGVIRTQVMKTIANKRINRQWNFTDLVAFYYSAQ